MNKEPQPSQDPKKPEITTGGVIFSLIILGVIGWALFTITKPIISWFFAPSNFDSESFVACRTAFKTSNPQVPKNSPRDKENYTYCREQARP